MKLALSRSRSVLAAAVALALASSLFATPALAAAAANKATPPKGFVAPGLRRPPSLGVRPQVRDGYEPDETWLDIAAFFGNPTYSQPIGTRAAPAWTDHNNEDEWGSNIDDYDFMWFPTEAGHTYEIFTMEQSGGPSDQCVNATCWEWDGTYSEWVPSWDWEAWNQSEDRLCSDVRPVLNITAPTSGKMLVEVSNNEDVAATYRLYVNDLDHLAGGTVTRISGANRYAVASNIAYEQFSGNLVGVTNVIITSGLDRSSCDPLAAAGLAGQLNAPILLINQDGGTRMLPTETRARIASIRNANPGTPIKFWIVGGTASVPDTIKSRIRAVFSPTTLATFERVSGPDRYSCAAAVANRISSLRSTPADTVFVANGETPAYFYSALAAGPICYANKLPLLLTRKLTVPTVTKNTITARGYTNRYFVGSPYDVSNAAVTQVSGATRYGVPWRSDWFPGYNRYRVARSVAESGSTDAYAVFTPIVVANKLPDALTGGCLAGAKNGVLLYTSGGYVEGQLRDYISYYRSMWVDHGYPDVYISGGPASVSDYTMWQTNYLVGTLIY